MTQSDGGLSEAEKLLSQAREALEEVYKRQAHERAGRQSARRQLGHDVRL